VFVFYIHSRIDYVEYKFLIIACQRRLIRLIHPNTVAGSDDCALLASSEPLMISAKDKSAGDS